ncbi:MAG: hypothetical protein Q8R55_03850 [Candidatus Taylorbacteria bacterium]|nr:hypothetical protein [Candidatus Taylorbacteria bacterium]
MKNNFIFTFIVLFFFSLFVTPLKVSAVCNYTNYSGSGIEQEAIDNCLRQQRLRDQQARDQLTDNSGLYQIKLTYFYKLDAIEKQIDATNASDSNYALYRLNSVDCVKSMEIPSDPTTLDPNLFLIRIVNKENCVNYLIQYLAKKPATTQTQQPTRTNDQICSDEFGQNWKWTGGSTCGCKDGYTQKNGECVTYDQSCNISYPNTIFQKIDATDGARICDCKTGYVWNEQRTSCVVAPVVPVKTNDQVCQGSFGSNSNWNGTKDSNGLLNCGCKQEFMWNSDVTSCVAQQVQQTASAVSEIQKPIILSPTVTQDQKPIIINEQIKSKQTTISAPSATEDKKPIINNEQIKSKQTTTADTDNKPTTTSPQQKGLLPKLWSWFKGLFSF